jgi:enoyl-CoA hydratase
MITVSKEPPIGIIALKRPEALNALNSTMAGEVMDALNEFEIDDSIVCVVLAGNEKVFSAGADIKEMASLTTVDEIRSSQLFSLWKRVGSFPKPIVGALSGHVLGGGLELAMCCDVLIASETTRMGQPEVSVGIIPGGGGTQRLSRAIGKYKAMEMILTGATMTAEEAKSLGLVSRVVPPAQFLIEAKKVAMEIASKPPLAVKLAKQAINQAQESGLSDGLDLERQLFSLLFSTDDKAEGMRAFFEKRKPHFTGK